MSRPLDLVTDCVPVGRREQNELHEHRNSLQNEKKELWSQEDSVRRYRQLWHYCRKPLTTSLVILAIVL